MYDIINIYKYLFIIFLIINNSNSKNKNSKHKNSKNKNSKHKNSIMTGILHQIGEFIITPLFRWFTLLLTIILTTLQYLNEPQRYSYSLAFSGLSYKWHLYIIAIYSGISTILTVFGLWIQIPFTSSLPDYWFLYLFVLYLALITQITIDSPQIADDGSFNPPPSYMLPQKFRVVLSYITMFVDFLIMVQLYIYFGISDITKKTAISRYVLERFGGWYPGNKFDFIFDWSGIIDTVLKIYLLSLQSGFQACIYGLPLSWNS